MEVIHLHHPYQPEIIPAGDIVLALGFFDGVHKGHQQVILTAKREAEIRHLPLAVMTFNHHPSLVFKQLSPLDESYLTTIQEKEELLTELGVDRLYLVEFTSALAALAPDAFIDQYIVGLHAQAIIAGFDYTFGANRATMVELKEDAAGRFDVIQVAKLTYQVDKISSTRIRKEIDAGNVAVANALLGYPYRLSGVVVHGEARGRTLGFPTVNVEAPVKKRIPGIGVYAVKILVNGQWYEAMASVGHNVTFGADRGLTIEIYILDFKQMVYGEHVRVAWFSRLRGEVAFDGADSLIKQLHQDEQATRDYFETHAGKVTL